MIRIKIGFIILLISLLSISCAKGMEEPIIRVSINSDEQEMIYYGDRYNKKKEEIEKRLKEYMIGRRFVDLSAIKVEDSIEIKIANYNTEQFQIYDYIIDEKCNIRSDFIIEPTVIRVNENNIAEYNYSKNIDSEVNTQNLKEEALYHCLLIRCDIENSSFTFATIVKEVTD